MERQFNRLSAEGWQLEGTGWLSFRYRRGAPNEYRYRVQYLYESATVRGTTMCAAPASCVSLCDFYRISMRECRGANGKNRLPFRGKRL